MTAIVPSTDIPSAINSVERLAAWVGLLLARINPTKAVLEDENDQIFTCIATIITAADGSNRLVLRLSIQLDPNYTSDRDKKLWMFAEDLSNTDIPVGFKSN